MSPASVPLMSFHQPPSARSNLALTSSTTSSSSMGDVSSAVIIRSSRRFACSSSAAISHSSEKRWKRCHCCSARIVAILLVPLLPIGIFLLTFLLLPVKKAYQPPSEQTSERSIHDDSPLVRLPTDVIPVHYELHLKVYLPYRKGIDFGKRNFTADGNLRLHLLCRQATNVLLLHAKALQIDHKKTDFWREEKTIDKEGPKVVGWKELGGGNDLLELRLDRGLLPGRIYILEMSYRAKIGRAHEGGLFQGSYTDEKGERKFLAATQMQPLDARRLLPCFDEPNFKAEFTISVHHPEGTTVLSNALEEHSRSVEKGWTLTLFERTPKMATYLLALTVSDFQNRETTYKGVTIRVWVQSSKLPFTAHALSVSARTLEYFEEYFGIPYPLKKLDIFGVPYLRVTAMENWGLILCRQQNLIHTEGVQAKRERQFITDVLAHEIAHMWFGDLVTMQWWDDLWLNEGFATIMGMKAADYVENSTARTSQLFYEHTVKAFRFDQVAHQAHALSYKISSVREVARRFDRITYLKAAAVLRMVERTVGEELFREGLRSFLRQFAFKNARSEDLLRALSAVENNGAKRALSLVNFSLSEFMDSWTYQTGFPLIRLSPLNSTSFLVSQKQFFYLQSPSQNPSNWKVPLFVEDGKSLNTVWLLEKGSVVLSRDQMLDPKAHGYYRIQYDNCTFQHLICSLLGPNHSGIALASRARLLEDSFTIARAGMLPFQSVLELSEYLTEEKEYLPFLVFINHVQHIYLLLRNYPVGKMFKDFIVQILEPMFQRIFSPDIPANGDIIDTMREFAMFQLSYWDYGPCVNRSLQEFAQIRVLCRDKQLSDRNCNFISPELRGPIYSSAIRHGTKEDFEFLSRKYFIEQYESERGKILWGLVGTTNIRLVNSILNQMIGNRKAMEEDFYGFLLKFIKSPILNQIVEYMKRNFRLFAKKVAHPQILKVVLTYMTKWMHRDMDLEQLDKFEREHSKELSELNLLNFLREQKTEIRANIDFVRRHEPEIFDYLERRAVSKEIKA